MSEAGTPLSQCSFPLKKTNEGKLLLSNSFLKLGFKELKRFDALGKNIYSPDDVNDVVAASFNISHGFELLLKVFLAAAGETVSGSHKLSAHFERLIELVPELASNAKIMEGATKTSLVKMTKTIEMLEENYKSTRYFSEGNKTVQLVSVGSCKVILVLLTVTFPARSLKLLEDDLKGP